MNGKDIRNAAKQTGDGRRLLVDAVRQGSGVLPCLVNEDS